jgi:hypothetical protein
LYVAQFPRLACIDDPAPLLQCLFTAPCNDALVVDAALALVALRRLEEAAAQSPTESQDESSWLRLSDLELLLPTLQRHWSRLASADDNEDVLPAVDVSSPPILPGRLPAGFSAAFKAAAFEIPLVPAAARRVRSVFSTDYDDA